MVDVIGTIIGFTTIICFFRARSLPLAIVATVSNVIGNVSGWSVPFHYQVTTLLQLIAIYLFFTSVSKNVSEDGA